ncbi:MAG: AmmeMemoRadiSam system protein B [Candidatus Bathyarchaeia archaeon]
MAKVREPAVSGLFYPDDPKTLRKLIQRFLDEAQAPEKMGEVIGLVSPHAGYIYSGSVAAYGYKALVGKNYDSAVIIGPSHRAYFHGISVFRSGFYRTPLGIVEIDSDLSQRIIGLGEGLVSEDSSPHIQEHSLEVQIPFLQVIFDNLKIVPIVMGVQERGTWRRTASILANISTEAKKKILLIASTDLSHYYSYEKAKKLDSLVLKNIEDFDVDSMERDFETERFEACGGGPMISVMLASKMLGAEKGIVLRYATSGDTSGDRTSVVGYVSAVFTR